MSSQSQSPVWCVSSIFPSYQIDGIDQRRRPKPLQALHRRKRRRSHLIRLLAHTRIDAALKFDNASAALVTFRPTLESVIGFVADLADENLCTYSDTQDVGDYTSGPKMRHHLATPYVEDDLR